MADPVNLHWKYYVDYFRIPTPLLPPKGKKVPEKPWYEFTNLRDKNRALLDIKASDYTEPLKSLLVVPEAGRFSLKTTYPGLLVGSGYRHQTGSDDELKLGFSFDFTTGLPIIPGSSVKGLLRSAFPGDAKKNQLHERAKAFIGYLLKSEAVGLSAEAAEKINVLELEKEIFNGQRKKAGTESDEELPMHERDIFHDALIGLQVVDKTISVYRGALLGDDFITPHRNRKNPKMSPFTNPTPIQFLKVMPNVPVTFQFDLPSRKGELLNPAQRLRLFEAIIRELGIGAKTRVGYGQLV